VKITQKIIELANGISCIDTDLNRPQMAACYLIEQDGAAGIIDTGTSYTLPTILSVLKYKNIPVENVQYVMPTHVHLDHAGGAGQLMQHMPNAQLIVHPRGARHLIDPTKLWQGTVAVYGEEETCRMYGELISVEESRVIIADDGFQLELNGRKLLFIDSPGHARHHYVIYDEQSQGFFTGDIFGIAYRELDTQLGPYIMPTTTPIQFDPTAWHATMDRLLSYQPQRMYLTHYGMVENVEQLAEALLARIDQYVEVAEQYANDTNRHEKIKDSIRDIALTELEQMDCPLPIPACKEILEIDMELNTKGLELWLDRR